MTQLWIALAFAALFLVFMSGYSLGWQHGRAWGNRPAGVEPESLWPRSSGDVESRASRVQ